MKPMPPDQLAEFCRNPYPDEIATALIYQEGPGNVVDLPVRILNTSAVRLRLFRCFP